MLNISAKQNLLEELEIVKIVEDLCAKYAIPAYTHHIIIEKGVIPHSHPILTLNTRTKDILVILQILIHEQFHWFTSQHPKYLDCIEYLKTKYQDNGECNKSGDNPNSFWEHIIVCFNTRDYLRMIVTEKELKHIYEQWQAYPNTELLIVDKYEDIREDLNNYDIAFNKNDLPSFGRSE